MVNPMNPHNSEIHLNYLTGSRTNSILLLTKTGLEIQIKIYILAVCRDRAVPFEGITASTGGERGDGWRR